MDGFPLDLTIFLVATFAGALVAGLSGFAFGLVAASIWLCILTPLQTGLPVLLAGTWLGMKLYGDLDETTFRKVVLLLLRASGAVLIFRKAIE